MVALKQRKRDVTLTGRDQISLCVPFADMWSHTAAIENNPPNWESLIWSSSKVTDSKLAVVWLEIGVNSADKDTTGLGLAQVGRDAQNKNICRHTSIVSWSPLLGWKQEDGSSLAKPGAFCISSGNNCGRVRPWSSVWFTHVRRWSEAPEVGQGYAWMQTIEGFRTFSITDRWSCWRRGGDEGGVKRQWLKRGM